MTDPNDKLLDEYLRRESAVSQRYRELDASEVPPQLDAAVLAQAHAAIAGGNKRKSGWMKWGAPLALAASAVIVVAIVLEVGVQDEVRMPAAQREQATSVQRAAEARIVEEVSPDVPVDVQRTLRAAPPGEISAQTPPADLADLPGPARAPQQAAKAEKATRDEDKRQDEQANQVEKPNQDALDARRAASAEERPDITFATRREASEPVAPQTAPPAATISQRPVLPAVSAGAAQQAPRLPPEEWLERIRTLRREAKVLEADEQWRDFREAYPEFEVSETDSARPQP